MKKIVVWGLGKVGLEFVKEHSETEIEFIIDNDINKCGNDINGIKIVHSKDVVDWNRNFYVIAVLQNSEIVRFLTEKGLVHHKDFVIYDEYVEHYQPEKLIDEIESFLAHIEKKSYLGKRLVFSHFIYVREGRQMVDFWNFHNEATRDLLLFCDADDAINPIVYKQANFQIELMPKLLRKPGTILEALRDVCITPDIETYVKSKEELNWVCNNLKLTYPEASNDACIYVTFYSDYVIRRIMKYIKPSMTIVFNSFRTWHYIVNHISAEYNVPVKYCEFGPIEGTFQFDDMGLMGETTPCMEWKQFDNAPIKIEDKKSADQIINYMYCTKINRYAQPKGNIKSEILNHFSSQGPLIIYMGQNDYEAGIQPYTLRAKELHSPVFSSSAEAANYLLDICKKAGYNFVYKPHPSMNNVGNKLCECAEDMYIIRNGDINDVIDCADVAITINSTVAYASMIRNKPTILLGYMQLSHHGCCYECYKKDEIVKTIQYALQEKITEKMFNKFIDHVARMVNFYLYDTMMQRELPYGKRDKDIFLKGN